MMENPKNVLLDTCVLINFLCIDRTDLLADHPHYCFMLTDHVRSEISEHYSEQLIRLENLLLSAKVEEITVNTPQELQAFAELSSDDAWGRENAPLSPPRLTEASLWQWTIKRPEGKLSLSSRALNF